MEQTIFDKIKNSLNIQEVICRETGLVMKGKHLSECPFCKGHECFSIQADKGKFKCFQCDAAGSVIDFFMRQHGMDESGALKYGAQAAGIEITDRKKPARLSTKDKIFIAAAHYYHQAGLKNGGRAHFIERRGHVEDTIKKTMAGIADGKLHEHLAASGFSYDDMVETGLISRDKKKEDRVYDFFAPGMAVYPHFVGGKIAHWTAKEMVKKPGADKKRSYQLRNEDRDKAWRFYNQDAADSMSELILVEGEDDLHSVLDANVPGVIGINGQISEDQIKTVEYYSKTKSIFIWMDNDEDPEKPFAKGKGYIRKLFSRRSSGMDGVKIIVYPDTFKDPDEFLRQFPDPKQKKAAIDRLKSDAVGYISWEIQEAGRKEDKNAILGHLEAFKVFQKICLEPEIYQQVFISKIAELGFSESAIREKLETEQDLKQQLSLYFETLPKKTDADPIRISDIMFNFFKAQGKFFRTRKEEVFLMYRNRVYEISNNLPFNALIMKTTDLLPTENPGRSVWSALALDHPPPGPRFSPPAPRAPVLCNARTLKSKLIFLMKSITYIALVMGPSAYRDSIRVTQQIGRAHV